MASHKFPKGVRMVCDSAKWRQRRLIIGDSLLMPVNNNHNKLSTSSSSSTATTNTISNNTFDTTTTTSSSPTSPPAAMVQQQQQEALKCPRCDSSHTKFCYYNNYSLSQPRHFCKACKRYWTRGGTLRSVPVGGRCRKNNKRVKKATPTTAAAASSTSNIPHNSSLVASPLPATTTTDHLNSLFYGLLPSATVASNMNLAGVSGFPTMYDQLQPQMSALGVGFSSGRRHDEEGSQLGFGACSSLADLQQTGSSFLNNYQASVNILEAGGSFDLPKQVKVKVEGENNVVRSNNSDGIEWQDQAAPDMNAAGDSSYLYWSSAIFGGAGWPDIANSSIAPMI